MPYGIVHFFRVLSLSSITAVIIVFHYNHFEKSVETGQVQYGQISSTYFFKRLNFDKAMLWIDFDVFFARASKINEFDKLYRNYCKCINFRNCFNTM